MGFRKNCSTSQAISHLVSYSNLSLNNNQTVGCVYVDMCKAFDCIQPQILFKKLSFYGLSPGAISWFKNYFSDRTQVVRINNVYSRSLPVHTVSHKGLF